MILRPISRANYRDLCSETTYVGRYQKRCHQGNVGLMVVKHQAMAERHVTKHHASPKDEFSEVKIDDVKANFPANLQRFSL